MNNSNSNRWLDFVNETVKSKNGKFSVKDQNFVIEWEKINSNNPEFNNKIKQFNDILIPTYVQQELEFARKYPEQVPNEFFLKSLAPLFEQNHEKLDWKMIEQKIQNIIEQFFISTDFAKFSKPDDTFFMICAKDKDGKVLGMIQFQVSEDFNFGEVRIGYFAIVSENQVLKELLISSTYKLIPETKRIFLHTRISNENLISFYKDLGFKTFLGKLQNWIDLEYIAQKNNKLQSIAEKSLIKI
jgi:ribosomal protein S18 acetylase RimI-like enzyme